MAVSSQNKVSLLAKSLGIKPKDITDLFAGTGLDVKSTSASLDGLALDVMWDKLTKANQIVNIDDYIDGITGIPSAASEKKADAVPAVKKETGAPEKQSGPAKAETEKTASKPEDNTDKNRAPENRNQPQGGAQREKQPINRSATERFESRNNAASAMAKDGSRKNDRKDEKKDRNRNQHRGIEIREKTASSGDEVRVEIPQNTRVVDTRGTTTVDLSKYDEKLDSFVTEDDKHDARDQGSKSKVKKAAVSDAGESASQDRNQQGRGKGGQKGGQNPSQKNQNAAGPQKGQQNGKNQGQNGKGQQNGKNQGQNVKGQQNGKNPNGKPQNGKGRDKRNAAPVIPPQPVKKQPVKAVIPDEITVGEFASRIKVSAGEVVKKLMLEFQMMVTVNQTIDFDTAALIAESLGAEVTREVVVSIEERLFEEDKADTEDKLQTRAPVVCVMGHVDHGKTSLLDAIRNTHVTAGEAGGITQHIGAYRVKINGKEITFLDTPGHEAFTAMRARGAMATDIAILVVAADDGIMPQTVEAINHAKAAGVEIIVAINKMDKPGANPEGIKQELTKYDLVPEEWGGDVMCVPVSALKHTGIDDLLENILLIAEVKEYKANPDRRAKGIVIESRLDKGRGPVATVLIQNGTLRPGDIVIAGTCVGRVRAMTDYTGRTVKAAPPSMPVEITGLDDVPTAGDEFNAVEDERMARELADQRRAKAKEDTFKANSRANLNDLFAQIKEGVKDLNIIVKADVGGSAEAVKQSLEKLSNDEVRVHVIHAAAGGISESDVMFAQASSAIIIGFNIRPDRAAIDSAERQGVEIRTYRVIYECIEEIEAAMKGMLAPKFKETLLGHAEVRQVIHVPNVGFIAGSYVQDGKITRSAQIRVVRDSVVVYEDKIASLRRFKDDVREVAQGYECGIGLEKFNDLKSGDVLEAFIMEKIAE
ncbi:MAG: translation initiation factor IF-2 [Clostridia bacterium]|nr:translation initiation factor IF-2 [Clostridia bacterium]